ncbi:hypothetical protein ID875_29180 [Streptomyces globisporus]|uniref:Thioesterase n=1 Tax=Streptomyces globisporus TaxID=1908 RepID=A0A927GPC9_STRGL|nr:hypothetical protein [Streptomyces globisporus]
MGALTGYELLRELARRKWPAPLLLAVSAHRAPQEMPTAAGPPAPRGSCSTTYDASTTAARPSCSTTRSGAIWCCGRSADLRLHDTYRSSAEPPGQPPLATPFVVLTGEDDPTVSDRTYAGWAALTHAVSARRVYPGGHFYLREQRDRLLTELGRDLENAMRGELR